MKEVIIALVVLAYVIPFAFMFGAVAVDVTKRMIEFLTMKLKPSTIQIKNKI